jgi:hypothetical protein
MDFATLSVNYIIINGHKFQVQHIAPKIAMGVDKLPTTDPKLFSTVLEDLVKRGLWNKDSTVYNLIALPTEQARLRPASGARRDGAGPPRRSRARQGEGKGMKVYLPGPCWHGKVCGDCNWPEATKMHGPGFARHDSTNRKAPMMLPAAVGTESDHDGG